MKLDTLTLEEQFECLSQEVEKFDHMINDLQEKQKEATTVIAKMTLLKESAIEKRASLAELMGMEQIELPLED
tara:strand:- start:903 stop:1121 length:219 start_codon:yes stop_codon:yes gene_type:complete